MMHAFAGRMKIFGLAAAAAVVVTIIAPPEAAHAQLSVRWLSVGDLHHPYVSGGAEVPAGHPFTTAGLQWPGILPMTGHSRNKGLWVSAKNWTDESGETWDVKTSHMGPRTNGIGEVFDVTHEVVARFEPPVVRVDGLETFLRPVVVEEVDESLSADRAISTVLNTSVGATVERRPMQWSNEYHDDYHIIEYTVTNTGNTDGDADIELPDQTLEDVYFVLMDHPTINATAGAGPNSAGGLAWGQYTMVDAVGDGLEDYDVDFRAQYYWLGRIPDKAGDFNTIGNPMWFSSSSNPIADDTLGRLGGAQMAGTVILHADERPHPAGEEVPDDRDQPALMSYVEWDWSAITANTDHTDRAAMAFAREWIERGSGDATLGGNIAAPGSNGRIYPHHADIVIGAAARETMGWSLERFANQTGDPSLGRAGGWGYANGFGPYDLAPGEQIRVVVAEGIAGLSDEAKYAIGRAYKLSGGDDELEIPFDADGDGVVDPEREIRTKNEWVMTTRDSLFQLFERAIANYEAGYQIPNAPLPPRLFEVTSGTDRIQLQWEPYSGAYGGSGNPLGGWEVWRAQSDYYGVPTALRVGSDGIAVPDSARTYELIAHLDGAERSYTDARVQRGLSYFYYIQAVGDVNTDAAGNTPTGGRLKSGRYYAQTYEPAFLRRSAGASLSEVRIVPNPFSLAQSPDVRFSDKQDKLAFYGLPGQARIEIYTEVGELVETIEHTDGSGDEFWDLTTSSRQVIVSGLYLAVIRDLETGDQVVRKFIVLR